MTDRKDNKPSSSWGVFNNKGDNKPGHEYLYEEKTWPKKCIRKAKLFVTDIWVLLNDDFYYFSCKGHKEEKPEQKNEKCF